MENSNFEQIINEEFYVLVAKDGSVQPSTLAPDFPMCVAMIKLLHSKGIGKSFHQLCNIEGCKILPVRVTIIQDGTEDKPFE